MATADQAKQAQWQKLFGFILGYQATWIVDIGLKAGLLRAVADAPTGITEEVLAQNLGFTERYVRVFCRAAYAFGLFEWDPETGYRLAPHMNDLLLNSKDAQFIGGRFSFMQRCMRTSERFLNTYGVARSGLEAPMIHGC